MKIPIIKFNSKCNSSHQISSIEEIKNRNEKHSNNKTFLDSLSSSKVNSNFKEKISNNLINNFRKSLVFKNQIIQVENFKNKIKYLGYEKNNKNERTSVTIERPRKNFHLSKIKDIDKFKAKKKRYSTQERKFGDLTPSPNKRRKKEKELDIISINIQNSSQNLNQPDIFYAGLFSKLIFKGSSNYLSNQNKSENDSISKKEKD